MTILGWFLKVLAAVVIWAAVTLLLQFIGGLLGTVDQTQVQYVGRFLDSSAGFIGFLFGGNSYEQDEFACCRWLLYMDLMEYCCWNNGSFSE